MIEDFEDNPDVIEIEQDDWGVAEAPEKIMTRGLGPCAGVLVYNKKLKKAILGHFVNVEGGNFKDFLITVREEMGKTFQRKVYLAGASPIDSSKEALKGARGIRNQITNLLMQEGIEKRQIKIYWNDKEDESASIFADTESGKIQVIKKDFSDLTDLST